MGMVLSVVAIGADEVASGLAVFMDRLADLRPFWRDVAAPRIFAKIQDRFNLQGQGRHAASGRFAGGGRWAPLSPRYRVWKDRFFPGKGILTRTGRLRDSMVWDGDQVGPEGLFVATEHWALCGTSVPYGVFHQTGTPKMPARPFLDAPDADEFGDLLASWLRREADPGSQRSWANREGG